jgi:hypothetical protein
MTATPKHKAVTEPNPTTEEDAPPVPPEKQPKTPASHVAGLGSDK